MSPVLIVELAALGLSSGFLAGLLGIGGGMLMVPFLTFILGSLGTSPELAVKMAIATSMATIMFTSISSVRAHHKRGAVRWPVVVAMAPGLVIGGLLVGFGLFALIKGAWHWRPPWAGCGRSGLRSAAAAFRSRHTVRPDPRSDRP
jgi:uncharacterized membrane protein YfcA